MFRDSDGTPRYYISQFQDVTAARRATDELTYQASHDPLTGLANRSLFDERLARAISRVGDGDHGWNAVLMLDLDDFKAVNDTFGHPAGDELLVQIARRFERVTRSSDTLCRLGGDEFVYLVEGMTSPQTANEVAERLLHQFDEPFDIFGTSLVQRASVGVATGPGDLDGEALLRNADVALYDAKRRGKGRHETFDEATHGDVVVKSRIATDFSVDEA